MCSLEQEALRAFAICDTDCDGSINQQEFAFFLRALGQNPTNAEVKLLPETADYDTAFKHYNENKKEPETEDHIRQLFKVWDKNNHGTIEFKDLAQCLKIFGSATEDNFTEEEIEHLKKEADVQGDTFEYGKFLDLMVKTQEPHLVASLDDSWPKGAATVYK